MDIRVHLCDAPKEEVRAAILAPLVQYNDSKVRGGDRRPLAVEIRNRQEKITGGLWGATHYGWLFTELLVVPVPLRGQGLGRRIMQIAELEALRRGCHSAWLDTFEFQARSFYERLGYSCFGELKDYPNRFRRFFMWKRLIGER